MLLHCFLEEFQGGILVPRLCNEAFQHLAFVIDGTPKVVLLAIDLHEHLVQVPTPLAGLYALDPALPNLECKHRAEPMPPEA